MPSALRLAEQARPDTAADRRLTSSVELTDDRMEDRVHDVFDHEIGRLHDTSDAIHEQDLDKETSVKAPTIPASTQAVRDMLANPDSVRQAVILSEILSRRGAP